MSDNIIVKSSPSSSASPSNSPSNTLPGPIPIPIPIPSTTTHPISYSAAPVPTAAAVFSSTRLPLPPSLSNTSSIGRINRSNSSISGGGAAIDLSKPKNPYSNPYSHSHSHSPSTSTSHSHSDASTSNPCPDSSVQNQTIQLNQDQQTEKVQSIPFKKGSSCVYCRGRKQRVSEKTSVSERRPLMGGVFHSRYLMAMG